MVNENQFLLHALLMGIFITFLYDILRIIRRVIPHKNIMVSLEDMLFWIYCAAEVFLLMHHESNGSLRWFAIFGALTGMLVYKKLVSSFFVKYVSLVLQKLVKMLVKIGSVLLTPFLAVGRTTAATANKAGNRIRNSAGHIRRFLKKKLTFFIKVLKMNL